MDGEQRVLEAMKKGEKPVRPGDTVKMTGLSREISKNKISENKRSEREREITSPKGAPMHQLNEWM